MLKKALLVSAIMAAGSTVAIAGTPYIGGSLGLTNLSYRSGGVQAGAIGKLFGGYGDTFGESRNIYLGGELNIDLAHYPYQSGSTYGLGASFIPGVMLTKHTLLYGRIGLEAERYTNSATSHLGNQLGLGLQTALIKSLDIRGEYVHTSNFGGNSQINLGLVFKFD